MGEGPFGAKNLTKYGVESCESYVGSHIQLAGAFISSWWNPVQWVRESYCPNGLPPVIVGSGSILAGTPIGRYRFLNFSIHIEKLEWTVI